MFPFYLCRLPLVQYWARKVTVLKLCDLRTAEHRLDSSPLGFKS